MEIRYGYWVAYFCYSLTNSLSLATSQLNSLDRDYLQRIQPSRSYQLTASFPLLRYLIHELLLKLGVFWFSECCFVP